MKKLVLFAAGWLMATAGIAQNNQQAFDWAMNPGSAINTLRGLKYDSQGNLLVLADMTDSANFGGNIIVSSPAGSYPSTNQYLAKRKTDGTSEIVLQRGDFPGAFATSFRSLNVDASDNIYIGGMSSAASFSFGNGVSINEKGYFIVKFNSSGVAQWANVFNFGNPNMTSFATDNMRYGVLPNGNVHLILSDYSNVNLITMSSNGSVIMDSNFTVSAGSYVYMTSSKNNFCVDNAGNFYFYTNRINETSISLDGDANTLSNGTHPATSFLWKYGPDGSQIYKRAWRGSIQDLAVDPISGNLYLSWIQYGTQENTAPMDQLAGNTGTFAVFDGIIKLDPSGNFLEKSADGPIPGSQLASAKSLILLPGEGVATTREHNSGYLLEAGSQTYTPASSVFTWYEYDANLDPVYFVAHPEYTASSATPDLLMANYNGKMAVSVAWSADDQPVLNVNGTMLTAHDKNTSFPTNYSPPYNMYGNDIMIAQFDRSLQGGNPVSLYENVDNEIVVYPNPASSVVYIQSVADIEELQVIDPSGKVILTSQGTHQIDLSEFNPGIYLIKISSGESQIVKRVIHQ